MRIPLLALLLLSLAAAPIGIADDNPEDFAAVLVPLTSRGLPGAHGSVWDAELHIFNASRFELRVPAENSVGQPVPPPPRVVVGPGETKNVQFLPGLSPFEEGTFLYIPKTMLDSVKLSLRVRDTSQNATSLGDEVPVVRSEQFAGDLTLFDVPVDPKYRATLRIYGFTYAPMPVRVTVYPEDGQTALARFDVELRGIAILVAVVFPAHPAWIAIDPLTDAVRSAAAGSRVRIEISNLASTLGYPQSSIWGFVSLTNNETNQVTLVTPK